MPRNSKKNTPASWQLCLRRTNLHKPLDPQPELILSEAAKTVIEQETLSSVTVETGGILVGHIVAPLTFHIVAASGPGPRAQRTATHFMRDTAFCSDFLRQHYEESGANYIRDWHSHLQGIASDELSTGDVLSLFQVINDPDYSDLPGFAKILTLRLNSSVSWNPFRQRDGEQNQRFATPKARLKGFVALRDLIVEVPIGTTKET